MRRTKEKKRSCGLLALMLVLLTACANGEKPQNTTAPATTVAETKEQTTQTPEQTQTPTIEQTEAPTVPQVIRPDKITTTISKRPGNNEDELEYKDVYFEDFESGTTIFGGRSGEVIEVISGEAYEGDKCLKVSNRTATWNGPQIDLTDKIESGQKFYIRAYVKYEGGSLKSQRLYIKMDFNNGVAYKDVASISCKQGEWTLIEGYIDMPAGTESARFYSETDYSSSGSPDYLVDIYMDNFYVQGIYAKSSAAELPPLYEEHVEYFNTGIAVTNDDILNPDKAAVIARHFNSMTMGNELKPDSFLDYETCSSDPEKYNLNPAIHTQTADVGLTFAKEHNIPLRGHTLVWHSQTPRWFFTENYSKDPDAPLATKEVMLARMESYIKQVLEYCQTNYPGVVYCWDVVNEAIAVSDTPNGYRSKDSLWYQICGEEFVEKAFEYARKYADPDVKLFYNDFNTYEVSKTFAIYNMLKPLVEKGLVDGMGMQMHIQMSNPLESQIEYAIRKFASLGIEIQFTELDISQNDNSPEAQMKLAKRYKRIMKLIYLVDVNEDIDFTAVTIWGLTDDTSWLNKDEKQYPLLFNAYLQAKDAFWGVFVDPSILDY